ncbi:hypothetical protein [Phycicoccus sonneratiae]|uniref:LppX_LprAFG lipoprotein n=1 Tax=Phycicoccus sonneratiae TaxID=2807628 RepID=A0ABS2CP71_9MICO|nr:hypothetical protein [Phycicoccus sonneraticus]MBM6401677.1 hypothetical protein [Phycicoccus sonneraticus]
MAALALSGCAAVPLEAGRPARPPASVGASTTTSPSTSPSLPSGKVDAARFFDDLADRVTDADTVDVELESPYESIQAEWQPSTSSARVGFQDSEQWLRVVVIGEQAWTLDEEKTDAPWRKVAEPPDVIQEALPSLQVDTWRDGTRSVTRGPSEVVEGHRITSYSLAVRAEQAYAVLGIDPPAKGPATVPVLLRLDDEGMPVQASMKVADGRLDIRYSGWGADLEIVAPPVG